jgi:hypothetical protein
MVFIPLLLAHLHQRVQLGIIQHFQPLLLTAVVTAQRVALELLVVTVGLGVAVFLTA